jgi:hypothetical protein
MTITLRRYLLVFLFVTALAVGLWAYLAPMSWYGTFPGFGRRWLTPLGPFNEHLVKDVGAMFLALGTLSAVALTAAANDAVVRLTAATWLTFNIFHFVYHMQMLHMYGAVDKTLNVIALSLLLVVSAGLLVPIRSSVRSGGAVGSSVG